MGMRLGSFCHCPCTLACAAARGAIARVNRARKAVTRTSFPSVKKRQPKETRRVERVTGSPPGQRRPTDQSRLGIRGYWELGLARWDGEAAWGHTSHCQVPGQNLVVALYQPNL